MFVLASCVCAEVCLYAFTAVLIHCDVRLSGLTIVQDLYCRCVDSFFFENGNLPLSYVVFADAGDECHVPMSENSGRCDRYVASLSSGYSVYLLNDYFLSATWNLVYE